MLSRTRPMRFTTPMLHAESRRSVSFSYKRAGACVLAKANEPTGTHPLHTRPKMVCLPSSQGVGASEMKNWQGADERASDKSADTARRLRICRQSAAAPASRSCSGPRLPSTECPRPCA
jgi:hypothetical protein